MPAALLIADRLTRSFDTRVAVSNLSLAVEAGQIVSLLGPNGAGKTTTLRMLAGLILPSSGHISINQIPVSAATADRARRSIGLLTETPGLWERLSVRTNLLTYARLHGLVPASRHVDAALDLVHLADRASDLAGALSKGLKQRLAIARALIHEPTVVLLDEPTSGLDPASARHIRDLVLTLRKNGCAVLVSTHNLAEAEELSNRIAILKTRLLALDTPAALRARTSGMRVTSEVEGQEPRQVPVADLSEVPDIVSEMVKGGARITRVVPQQRTLEEVYLGLVGDN
jgi:ABC-2 type transport system ATP-binding protein